MDRELLKRLWRGEDTVCPECGRETLIPLHKKKKDNLDWQCPGCGAIFRTVKILCELLESGE